MLVEDQSEVTAVGIGSAGIRIVSLLSRKSLVIDRFVYVSCDRGDFNTIESKDAILIESPIDQKLTPAIVRGLALGHGESIRNSVAGSKVVFVVAGLGGATGSGLAPVVASLAQYSGSIVVGVAVMPFDFEKKLKFYAGVSLRRLRSAAKGVIVVDNDNLMRSSSEDATLSTLYDTSNKAVVKALGSLLAGPAKGSKPLGLGKVLGTVAQDGYSLLGVSSSDTSERAEDALAGAAVSLGKIGETSEARHAVVNLISDKSLSAQEVGLTVGRLGSVMDNDDIDIEYGVDYAGTAQLQVALLASGFKSTKYDDYDPLAKILGDRVIDEDMDTALVQGLELLPPCD